jgi:hypothetical protein
MIVEKKQNVSNTWPTQAWTPWAFELTNDISGLNEFKVDRYSIGGKKVSG